MRWNITQECENFQQSSFIVSNTARRSYDSFGTSRTEIAASTLLDSEILRVIPDEGMHYAMSTEKRYPLFITSIINSLAHVLALAMIAPSISIIVARLCLPAATR